MFYEYIKGDIQKPHIYLFLISSEGGKKSLRL